MKKAFDQTVRDLKREVNKKVLKVPAIEQKILDATSNEPWGPHGSLLADIAHSTRNYHEYQIIMTVVWKRINDIGKNWRHVYKGLIVLDYLVAHGSERVIDEIREHAYQIATLSDFQYIDSSGKDQGSNVRKKSQSLVALVNDKDRIQEVRQKAYANRDKYRSTFSTGGMHRPGSFSGSGSYGDHYDDDHYHGRYGNREDDGNGYGRDRDWSYRDDDRYARGDSNGRDGDQYNRDSDERYGRDGYRTDDYRGSRGNDDYQFGSRNRSVDRDVDRSLDEDDQFPPRSGGGKIDEPSHDDRQIERKFSDRGLGAPPSYEEVIAEPHNHVQDEREGGAVQAPSPVAQKASSPSASTIHGQIPAVANAAVSHSQKEIDAFDEFDPRGSATAAPRTYGTSLGMDTFGLSSVDSISSLALVPVTGITSEAHLPNNSDIAFNQPTEDPFGDSPFKAIPQDNNAPSEQQKFSSVSSFPLSSNTEVLQQVTPMMESLASFDGNSVHAATSNVVNGHVSLTTEIFSSGLASLQSNTISTENLQPYTGTTSVVASQVFQPAPVGSSQPNSVNILSQTGLAAPPAPQAYHPSFLPQTELSAPVFSQASPYPFSQQWQAAAAPVLQSFPPSHLSQPGQPSQLPTQEAPNMLSQPVFSAAAPPIMLSQSGFPASGAPKEVPVAMFSQGSLSASGSSKEIPATIISHAGLSASGAAQRGPATSGPPSKSVSSKDKFETKSTVWADTLSRGLVNLNISGPKINPLADIGIDFDSINRMEKRREREKSSAAPVSTVSMGKAMGAGSGVGHAGARGLAPPPNPMIGSGMAVGMGTGSMGVGMVGMDGYSGGMNQSMGPGIGMNMGMGQGAQVRPPMGMPSGPAMPGIGYNPMTGMGGYGSHQYGGYR